MSDEIVIHIVGDATGATSAINSVNNSTKALSESFTFLGESGLEAGNQIAEGMHKAEYSTMEARHAAMLLGEETGVRIPRALSGIAARSEALGPILASAFSVIALVAFAELAAKAAEKFAQWYSDTFIFTEAMKSLDSVMGGVNKDIVEQNAKLKELQEQYKLIGLTGSELSSAKFELFNADKLAPAEARLQELKWAMVGFGNSGQSAAHNLEYVNGVIQQFNQQHGKEDQVKILPDSSTLEQQKEALSAILGATMKDVATMEQEGANQQKSYEIQVTAETRTQIEARQKMALEYAKAGIDITNQLTGVYKLSATAQAEANGLIALAHRNLMAEIEPDNKALEAGFKAQLEGELKIAEATEKDALAQLKLNAAIMRGAAEHQADVVAQDKASGNIAKMVKDEQTLIDLLKKQENAELAIVDAKIQEAQAAMQVAFASGGLGTADFMNAEAAYRTYQAQRVQIAAEADKQIAAASDNELRQETKGLNTYLKQGNTEFGNFFSSVAMGHETMGKAAIKMYDQMGTALIKNLVMAMAAELEGLALHKTVAAEKQLTDAKGAAAGAYNAVADIPYIGPILAPIAAATAFAAVMAFDKGGMVPDVGGRGGHSLAVVQGGERVLTQGQNEALEKGLSGGKAPVVAHFTFAPTINNPFNAEKDGPAMMKFAQKSFKRMGVNL